MMNFNKPKDYDEVQAGGEYTPIELGGHKLVIKKIEEVTGKDYSSGREYTYLKISFDTAPDDVQPGYYMDAWKNDTREQKKWGGVATLFPYDKEGRTSKTFKQFCTSIERSNNSTIQWGAGFEASIVGKVIGGVFGEEEYYGKDCEIKTARKLFWWRSVEGIKDAKIPKKRELEHVENNGFTPVDDIADDDLPF